MKRALQMTVDGTHLGLANTFSTMLSRVNYPPSSLWLTAKAKLPTLESVPSKQKKKKR